MRGAVRPGQPGRGACHLSEQEGARRQGREADQRTGAAWTGCGLQECPLGPQHLEKASVQCPPRTWSCHTSLALWLLLADARRRLHGARPRDHGGAWAALPCAVGHSLSRATVGPQRRRVSSARESGRAPESLGASDQPPTGRASRLPCGSPKLPWCRSGGRGRTSRSPPDGSRSQNPTGLGADVGLPSGDFQLLHKRANWHLRSGVRRAGEHGPPPQPTSSPPSRTHKN